MAAKLRCASFNWPIFKVFWPKPDVKQKKGSYLILIDVYKGVYLKITHEVALCVIFYIYILFYDKKAFFFFLN